MARRSPSVGLSVSVAEVHMTAARWLPDPTGRHEYRYHDGQRWTGNVADQGESSTDACAPAESRETQVQESLRRFTKWSDKQMHGAASWVSRRGRRLPADE